MDSQSGMIIIYVTSNPLLKDFSSAGLEGIFLTPVVQIIIRSQSLA
jgi:hypothetical protein